MAVSAFRARRVYVDTSVWVAVLTQEPGAAALLQTLEDESGQLLTAMWTRTELASALAIKARRGELAQERLSALCREFELWVAGGVSVVPVDSVDFVAAAKQCEHMESKLRAGDALHLCVARRCQVTHLFSLDKDMLENADVLGIQKIER